jgi:hypothetical protein
MTKSMLWVIEVVSLSALLLGCSGNQETPAEAQSAQYLFMDPHSSGPRLDVFALGDGGISVSVGGPIGSQTDSLLFASSESLSDLYRLLHPEVTSVPGELLDLERTVAPELEALAAPRAVGPAAGERPPAIIEKSRDSFRAATCKNFYDGVHRWIPMECNYNDDTLGVWAGTPSNVTAGDRTYGWNDVGGTAQLCWGTLQGVGSDWCIQLPQYWWNWQALYSGGPYHGFLHSNSFPQISGPRGLTHHVHKIVLP